MRENRTYGSEGGKRHLFPTPIAPGGVSSHAPGGVSSHSSGGVSSHSSGRVSSRSPEAAIQTDSGGSSSAAICSRRVSTCSDQ